VESWSGKWPKNLVERALIVNQWPYPYARKARLATGYRAISSLVCNVVCNETRGE
jgi:hypothetical protein